MDISELIWFGLMYLLLGAIAWEWDIFDYSRERGGVERARELARMAIERWSDAA